MDRFTKQNWPELLRLYELGFLTYIDLAFAKQFQEEDEELAALYCYMLLSMRSGHLCVQIDDDRMIPNIKELIPSENECFKSLILYGAKKLPENCPFIKQSNNLFYLQKNWNLETQCITHFQRLINDVPKIEIDFKGIPDQMNQMQKEAIQAAGAQCLTIICGGPGTGKTYTAGNLISLLIQASCKIEIVLTAPTGKAAANLQHSIQRAVKNSQITLKAATLHSLLGVNKWNKSNEIKELTADVVLVDESSMIDVQMMVRLLSALKKGGRLILLGDPQQLPPVEIGHFFNDMIDYLEANEKTKRHVVLLKECLRAENQSLIKFAESVQRGQCQAALHFLTDLNKDVYRIEEDPVEFICSHFSYLDDLDVEDLEVIKKVNRFRALSPLKKGKFGVEHLNQLIQEHRQQKKSVLFPIILTHHAKDLDLYNGDTGLLVMDQKKPFALFEGENSSIKKIPLLLLPKYEFAYCLSVHKSQGSEFNHVILLLPEGSEVFGRQAFYTAITRAKQKLCICGSEPIIEQMIGKKTNRISGLQRRLHSESLKN